MILAFKQTFPDGTATNYENKIIEGSKIHTLREGNRWQEGYFIHMATGVRTKQYNQFNKERKDLQLCKGTKEIFMSYKKWGVIEITVDDRYLMPYEVDKLISNDGLLRHQFVNWFFSNKEFCWGGQIIHWTDFKYTK